MLERLLQKKITEHGLDADVESVGTHVLAKMHVRSSRHALRCMRERGIDISGHRSRHITGVDLLRFTLVVAMTVEIAVEVKKRYGGAMIVADVPNPFARSLAAYKTCVEQLEGITENIVGAL